MLDVLHHNLGFTGINQVCEMGECGACTVLVDSRAMNACPLVAVDCDGRESTKIEDLGRGDDLHPV